MAMWVSKGTSTRQAYEFQPYEVKQLIPTTRVIPKGRSGHRIVSDNDSVYSFGGFNPNVFVDDYYGNGNAYNAKLFKELWKFNFVRQEWTKLDNFTESMPKQLASNAVIKKGNCIVVHGGTGMPFGLANTNKTYIADLKKGIPFSLIPAQGNHPTGKYGQAIVMDGCFLYVVGGTNGFDYSIDVHRLNFRNMVWEEKYLTKGVPDAEPQGRYRHEIVLHNNRILIFGGGTDIYAFGFEFIPAFNLATDTWETMKTFPDKRVTSCIIPRFPPPRRCHGCVLVPASGIRDPQVIICGGFDGINMYSDIWRLNLRTLDWSNCNLTLPYSLYFHSASLSPNGQMFLFGGICENITDQENYTTRTNDIFAVWVTIPTLKEMCWDAIIHYCPSLSKFTQKEIMSSGVPKDLADRINA